MVFSSSNLPDRPILFSKEKTMHRLLVVLFAIFCLCSAADAKDTLTVYDKKPATRYFHKHKITNAYDGEIVANDHLLVQSRTDKEMTFILSVISNENDECLIEGTAARISGSNAYEYRQNKCRLIFVFGKDRVQLQASGATGDSCYVSDLNQGHGCGGQTCLLSGTYMNPKAASTRPSR